MKYLSSGQLAKRLGVHRSTISRTAAEFGIGSESPHGYLFTEADIPAITEAIEEKKRRRYFKPGNDLWKLRENSKK